MMSADNKATQLPLPVRRVTNGPKHHFFGYYDKRQWDPSGRYLLAYEAVFMDRPQTPDDRAIIGMVDLEQGDTFYPLAETKAWCWQQGAMLQWLPGSASEIIYNDRIGDRFLAVVLDVFKGTKRVLPRPIYCVSNDAKWGLSLNFSRLNTTRPGYGYKGLHDYRGDDPHPDDDGIYIMNLQTGEHHLIVDLESMAATQSDESMAGATHWFNHLLFSPDDDRFIFLHRWSPDGKSRKSRMYTAAKDGTQRHRIPIEGASHFIWYDDNSILVWARTDEYGSHYYLCKDMTDEVKPFGEGILVQDGHCTVSPDGKWVLTDEYPDKQTSHRPLILYRIADGKRYDVGKFFSPPELKGEIRCDLHPKWSPDGRFICIDSAHEGSRQVYVLDASELVEA